MSDDSDKRDQEKAVKEIAYNLEHLEARAEELMSNPAGRELLREHLPADLFEAWEEGECTFMEAVFEREARRAAAEGEHE